MLGEQLPEYDTCGKDVALSIEWLSAGLFGAHVAKLSLDRSRFCGFIARFYFCDPEIDKLHMAVVAEHDILRTYVPVNYVESFSGFRILTRMRVGEAF